MLRAYVLYDRRRHRGVLQDERQGQVRLHPASEQRIRGLLGDEATQAAPFRCPRRFNNLVRRKCRAAESV